MFLTLLNRGGGNLLNSYFVLSVILVSITATLFKINKDMKTNSIIKKVRKELKKDGEIPTQKQIKITLLRETLNTYNEANRLIEENGYLMNFNDGKTKGQNPMLKVKFDSLKIIIKLLNDLLDDIEEEDDTDDFIESLLKD